MNKKFEIVIAPTLGLLNELYANSFSNRDDEMNNLIDFVNLGNKVIPPAFIKIPRILMQRNIENNKTFEIYTKTGLQIHDGCHRISLAKGIGLTEIPILVFDYMEEYKNSLMRWITVEGYEWEINI